MGKSAPDFRYFNPVKFFDSHAEVEELFLHWTDYDDSENRLQALIPEEDFPGLSLLRNYYVSHTGSGFGAFSTAQLIASEQDAYEKKTDQSAANERESLEFFLSVVDKCLQEEKAKHKPEDDPNAHLPYSLDSESLSDWNWEKQKWDDASKRISDMENLMGTPYTLHVVLEDKRNVFINETERYRMTFMDSELPMITKALGPNNIFLGRLFDIPGPLSENELMFLRQKTKSTFRGVRIALKRNVNIKNGKIISTEDLYRDNFTEEGPKTTDPFLQDVYYKRRGDANIGDIIQTIQSNQMDIVACPYDKHVFVQGVAGSGKTMVLLQRLSDMVSLNRNLDTKKVFFILPNPEFGEYFDAYFEERHLTTIGKATMASYLMGIVARYYAQFAESSFIETTEAGKVVPASASPSRVLVRNLPEKWKRSTCIDKFGSTDVRKVMYSSPLTKLIKDVTKAHKTKKIRVEIPPRSDYNKAQAKGFAGSYDAWVKTIRGDDPSFSNKNPYVDLQDFERLIAEFLRASRSLSKDKSIPITFEGIEEAKETISTALAYGLVKFLFETFGPLKEKYQDTFLAIDECQDYNYRVFQVIHQVSPKTVLNLFGDIAQDIGFHGNVWDKSQGIAEQIENHVDFKFVKYSLLENYRNSNEILAFCKQTFGIKDQGYGVSTMEPAKIDLKRLIALLTFHKTLRDRSAIIYDRDYETAVRTYLKPLFEHYGFADVKILDPVDAKGLEFDNVFIVGYVNMNFNERYVASTRALNELYIVQTRLGENE